MTMITNNLDTSRAPWAVTSLLCLLLASVVMVAARAADGNVMRTITRVKWDDPLNPRHVNLGNDQFLFGTRLGVKFWSLKTNEFEDIPFASGISHDSLISLDQSWVRMGKMSSGTAFLASGEGGSSLLWWNAQQRQIAAVLKLDSALGTPTRLLRLDAQNVLVCYSKEATAVIAQLTQSENRSTLTQANENDPNVLRVLERTNVVGPIMGFGKLTAINEARPLFYNTSRCGWEFQDPPAPFKSLIQQYPDKVELRMYPIFLSDGRVLITMADYHYYDKWRKLNPPLLWQAETHRWIEIEAVRGDGTTSQSIGQPEPVMSHSFESDVVEFLDTSTMTWRRSVETLPDAYGADIEPLNNGNALVILREDRAAVAGIVGQVAPVDGLLQVGQLAQHRSHYDVESSVRGNLMLFGDGDAGEPSSLIEVIDTSEQQAYKFEFWPTPH